MLTAPSGKAGSSIRTAPPRWRTRNAKVTSETCDTKQLDRRGRQWLPVAMCLGYIRPMASGRRGLVSVLVLALLLPVLIGLLPIPALSATAALERDIAVSLCDPLGEPLQQGSPQHQAGHDHCILCGTSCPCCSPGISPASAAFASRPASSAIPLPQLGSAVMLRLLALLDVSPPRGPPSLS
jgi:hypothetical protein